MNEATRRERRFPKATRIKSRARIRAIVRRKTADVCLFRLRERV